MTLAGEKKCMPMTLSGRDVAAAMSLMSRALVFDARIAPGLQMASRSPKISRFRSRFSKTASITTSQSAKSLRFTDPVISDIRSSTSAAEIRPRDADRS